MAVFASSDDFYAVMQVIFDRLIADPAATKDFQSRKMIVRIKGTDPEVELLLNGKTNPIQASMGPQPGKADLGLLISVDLLHRILTDQESLRAAFMDGRMKVTGNVFRAMQLADLFRKIEAIYPQVMQEQGYVI
ncbi:MAG: SCP2 sterol-binding domain-containing protein [Anaerolineae bacterium]|nr:SCP2 sterol-binding domain-containing protein [Anaerolineae bacterium]MCB0245433.1 SCP2 sterol-binding domain-containing protein [Anaerolineae bacterium]MCB9132488.1 SCP2 sterol-binding domain-containing protein [Anaerolineales bacterium]MCB9143026.1 SCP2 sterol-binding domain-containing protein [Anaerolineales bacterium]MCO5245038.1 SCP2 sterol-binding domain-containing protein [Anaerolineae bacterium]